MRDRSIREEFSYTTRLTSISHVNEFDLERLIYEAKSNLDRVLKSSPQKEQRQLIQAQLNKINSLKKLSIPTKDGPKTYYSIADKASGVTEKTCLIDEDTLKKHLLGLSKAETFEEIKANQIHMNAIIKHPKAGNDKEVQREAIGLKIAQILGFNVTDFLLVLHNTGKGWRPCLFVPFGDMELLTEFIDDAESMHGRLKEKCFQLVEDFGKYSSFFRIACDPDFIGKEGQNKGLTGEASKQLYIFDQVFMITNNFSFDKAFNLVPTNPLVNLPNAVARHFIGRNKSVINDSSFEEKIQSAIDSLQKKDEIRDMLEEVAMANSNAQANPAVREMQEDAQESLKIFNERILSIAELFPALKLGKESKQIGDLIKDNDHDNLNLLKKAMLVTQLINKPKLYDSSGKPYRAPFFTNPSTYVNHVSIDGNDVTVSFARGMGPSLSKTKKALLEQQGFSISQDGESASIPKDALLRLNEQSYYKEQEEAIDETHKYLNLDAIEVLANVYNESSNSTLEHLIKRLLDSGINEAAFKDTLNQLDHMPFKNKGFAAHIKQCCLYEAVKLMVKREPLKKKELQNGMRQAKSEGQLEGYVLAELRKMVANRKNSYPNFRTSLRNSLHPPSDEKPSSEQEKSANVKTFTRN